MGGTDRVGCGRIRFVIQVIPYQARWRDEFLTIGRRLRTTLDDLALRIDHIGSTSVPGLAAKDVIDIQVTLRDFEQFDVVREQVEAAGFELGYFGILDTIRPEWSQNERDWEKAYFRQGAGERRIHIHVRANGRANQRYALTFRDYLRHHPKVAHHYAEMKYKMAEYFGHLEDHTFYIEGKDPIVNLIATLAKEWAEQTGWVVEKTDL
jgi:GrpB-like predicted nucleotidyltransferase (UPF0157 family)